MANENRIAVMLGDGEMRDARAVQLDAAHSDRRLH